MKLIIQIPARNHEATLGLTLDELPRQLPGIDEIEWLVIDDASDDSTRRVAQARGVDHVVRLVKSSGVGACVHAGIEACLDLGADLIVTTDAVRGYEAEDIPVLLAPLMKGEADIVVANRSFDGDGIRSIPEKLVSKVWNRTLSMLGRTPLVDFGSGFVALTRDAACHLRLSARQGHSVETVMQAGYKGLVVDTIDVLTRARTRPRAIVSAPFTMLSTAFAYRPLPFFLAPAVLAFASALWNLPFGLGVGTILVAAGSVAHLTALNRRHLEDLSVKLDRLGDMVGAEPASWGNENPPQEYLGKVDASTEVH